MTMTLAESPALTSHAERLRLNSVAVRVSLRWLGVRKTLTPEQKSQAAESFGAATDYLSARKKLLDTTHPAFKEVTAVRGRILAYWKGMTLPYPEPGVRLLRQKQLESFHEQMQGHQADLEDAVEGLNDHYEELKSAARRRLGQLFNDADYPRSLEGWFGVDWDFPSVDPPDYLLQLHPDIYEQEKNRVSQRFQQAIELAEQAFLSEFGQLVGHLCERLGTDAAGQKKVFRDSAIVNLREFFDKFRQLNLGSSQELDDLVKRAQRVIAGCDAQELRDNDGLRKSIARQLTQVQSAMDQMLIDQPRRRIVRNQPAASTAPDSQGVSGGPHGTGH